MPGMLKSRDRSRSRDVSRPIFDGLGLGLEGSGLGLEGSGLVNIPAKILTHPEITT